MRVLARAEQFAALDGFLDDVGVGLMHVLLITGAIGIGKTTLWREAIERAGRRGHLVLPARPVAGETALGYAGLSDLIEPVARELTTSLPAPQRRAIESALLQADPDTGALVDPRSVAVGVLGGLRGLAEQRPVLIAVDDLQWLDEPTRGVLSYVIRRAGRHPIGLIATARAGSGSGLAAAFDGDGSGLATLALGPLEIGAVRELLADRLDPAPDQRSLVKIFEASGGNPFVALELAAAVREPGEHAELSVPESLRSRLELGLADLDGSTRRLLLLAALAPDVPSAAVLNAAGPDEPARADLEIAIEAQLLDLQSGRITFRQPLLRSVVVADATGRERRAAHRALADAISQPLERARHLALAVDGPDADLAAEIDAAAQEAQAGNQTAAAAELAELALSLTPPERSAELRQRTMTAAALRFSAGDSAHAQRLVQQLAADLVPGPDRAGLLAQLATYQRYSGESLETWTGTLESVLAEAGDDIELRLRAHLDLGLAAVNGGDMAAVAPHVAGLRTLVDDCTDDLLRSQTLAAMVWVDFMFGDGIDAELVQRALDGYEPAPSVAVEVRPTYSIATAAALAGDLDLARTLLDREYVDALRRGNDGALPFLTWELVYLETWAGNWARAGQLAEHGHRAAERADVAFGIAVVAASRAALRAAQGNVEGTMKEAELARRVGESIGLTMPGDFGAAALGALAISQGDATGAHAVLGPLIGKLRDAGETDPGMVRFVPDEAEALVRLGEAELADDLLAPFGAQARRLGRGWAIAATARCRGLIAITRGDLPAALTAVEEAVDASSGLGMPIEHGRALLVAGEVHRRARRKRRAHEHLTAAKAVFDAQGAVLWSARCRDELARTGLRTGAPPTISGLTRAEQRVAELAAEGYTTKQIAGTLFTGVRTVEAHLQRVYRKLSVHSRLELARRMNEVLAEQDKS